jgi:dTMP kinase
MFATFEGPEGSGKTTVIGTLAESLRAQGRDVVVTREPGAGPFGSEIRRLLLECGDLPPASELFLFLADRACHVAQIVRPALERGAIVLCDRYTDSTLAYQGYGRGFDRELLRRLNAMATQELVPAVTFLLDLPPAAGLARLTRKDRLDAEALDFHERVRAGFLTEAERAPHRFVIVDASRSRDDVYLEVSTRFRKLEEALAVQ